MVRTTSAVLAKNFMGNSPGWYKTNIIFFLILNPIIMLTVGPVAAGWLLVAEFIYTLAMALKCYPLLPGGLLALEAIIIGLTNPDAVYHQIDRGLEVILLLIFMVAGIYFMKDLLLFIFTKLLIKVRNKVVLGFMFCIAGAVLSAFLDALTVTAVVIAVAVGFYGIYHRFASGGESGESHDRADDSNVPELHRSDLDQFRAFLRSLLMHAAVGTALGGVCTLVGEPQNLLVGSQSGWAFAEFYLRMAPVTMPVLVVGLTTCVLLEMSGWFGYGAKLPSTVRKLMVEFDQNQTESRTRHQRAALVSQGVIALWLIIGLLFHLAPVGLIGLSVIVLTTVFTGITEEHQIGDAFKEALPFTALLVVFFSIVAVIDDQHLFRPLISWVLKQDGMEQISAFYIANGILSSISDNVFVASVYIGEAQRALTSGIISRDQYDFLAVAINTGTNIPSVATPNGQAAFLFLLTSAIAPLVRLSYSRMVIMALPYTIIMSLTGYIAVMTLLEPVTDHLYNIGALHHHAAVTAPAVPGGLAPGGLVLHKG